VIPEDLRSDGHDKLDNLKSNYVYLSDREC